MNDIWKLKFQCLLCRICDLIWDSLDGCKSQSFNDRNFEVRKSIVGDIQFLGQTSEEKFFQMRFDLKRHNQLIDYWSCVADPIKLFFFANEEFHRFLLLSWVILLSVTFFYRAKIGKRRKKSFIGSVNIRPEKKMSLFA